MFFNLTEYSQYSQVFYSNGSTTFQVWQKPAFCKMVAIFCIGGGGGGGGGQAGTANTTRRGGGGGGSSGYSIGLFAASQIPDSLFLAVGPGGLGGASAISGTIGSASTVWIRPDTSDNINILISSGGNAGGGAAGATGTAGTAGSIWSGQVLNDLGLVSSYAGQAGTAGATGAATSITPVGPVSGGAGGGGVTTSTTFDGGSITGSGFLPTVPGGSSAGDRVGSSGYNSLTTALNGSTTSPLFFTGGAGGAASNLGTGGDAGYGAFGSGGGGGAAGVTGGRGGNGGNGLIIINCY